MEVEAGGRTKKEKLKHKNSCKTGRLRLSSWNNLKKEKGRRTRRKGKNVHGIKEKIPGTGEGKEGKWKLCKVGKSREKFSG